jgi:hypothetical protein
MKLLREPLGQFVALGIVLFVVYALASDLLASDEARRIAITESEIELLATTWERQWQRAPTAKELHALVDSRVREEVLYREALALGLDRNDVVVRRRMVQKMELLSQDLALLADPTDPELQAFFDENREDYRIPPRVSFSHVYFNADRRGEAVLEDAERVLAEIRAQTPQPTATSGRGDRFMLAYDYVLRSPREVQQAFGGQFARAVFELEPGWHGPVLSGYGAHLVHLAERVESRLPELGDVRQRVVGDFNRARSERAKEVLYQGLKEGYEVDVDRDALAGRVLPAATDIPWRGMFSYMADAALFTACDGGQRYPVAQEADYLALERAYLAAEHEPGEALLVAIVGRVDQRPPMEGEGTRETLIVERFVEIRAGASCVGDLAE